MRGCRRADTLYQANIAAIKTHLTKRRGLPLSAEDLQQLEAIYYAFYWDGPNLRYTTAPPGTFGLRGGGRWARGSPATRN